MTDVANAYLFDAKTLPLHQVQLIEASAGTGKTYAITNLFLRLLLGRDQSPRRPLAVNEILVLTFTISATDELKHRITERINQARIAYRLPSSDEFLSFLVNTSQNPIQEQKLLKAACTLMDEASIFTIHGFCSRVLSEQSFESGILFKQTLNADRRQILQAACEDCFRQDILTMTPALRQLALQEWPNPAMLAQKLQAILFRGELTFYPGYRDVSEQLLELIEKIKTVKLGWIDQKVEKIILAGNLHKGLKPSKRLNQMTDFCAATDIGLESELWQVYSNASLRKAVTKKSHMPLHPVLDLIEEIFSCLDVIASAKANLWHEVSKLVSQRIQLDKDKFHKMTLDDLLTTLASAVTQPDSPLKHVISKRWPVVMIDEFQDTDSIQNSIFNTVYGDTSNDDTAMMMIGDPKQAIYNFRGADVFSYINARKSASSLHSLDVNWRSSPLMVEATNFLFQDTDLFGSVDTIPYEAVTAAPKHQSMVIRIDQHDATPFQLFYVGREGLNSRGLQEQAMSWAAEQTAQLLCGDATTGLHAGDLAPIQAGQIAFLVQRRVDAVAAQAALSQRGIKSVYLTLDSIFLTDTAADLKTILTAVLEPGNERGIRAALASRLLQVPAGEIDRLNHDPRQQQKVQLEFQVYFDLWRNKNIAPMLNALITRQRIAQKWLGHPDGERQLTNLRHLIEILQQHVASSPGMHQLVNWFTREQQAAETAATEDQQLRLESDENLVKIVTMHAAKGLEYDIVMIPMPVFSRRRNKGPALFHEQLDGMYRAALDLSQDDERQALSHNEQAAEDMRLLYVALTRARYRCYLGLPRSNSFSASAFAKLIGAENIGKDEDLLGWASRILPANYFEVIDGNQATITQLDSSMTASQFTPPPPSPKINSHWKVHSYTGIANRLTQEETTPTHVMVGFTDDDKRSNESPIIVNAAKSRFSFPRGARIGVALHALMEDVDFMNSEHHEQLCLRTLTRIGLDEDWLPTLSVWLTNMLQARLHENGLRLVDVHLAERLDELEFHLPINTQSDSRKNLITFLKTAGYLPLTVERTPLVLEGMLTGLIDMVFRHEGRYYLADYKSNHLGDSTDHYQQTSLSAAMDEHQYDLQYLLYTLALHRFLQHRLPGYDYEQDFGGVFYLFLRGMTATADVSPGVYFAKPDWTTIRELDRLLGVNK